MNRFPNNKSFAFSIFDDTDSSTVESIQPAYRLLRDPDFIRQRLAWTAQAYLGAQHPAGDGRPHPASVVEKHESLKRSSQLLD